MDKYELNIWQTMIFHTECFPLQMKNQLQNGCSITYTFTERQNLVCTFSLFSCNGRYRLPAFLWVFQRLWTVYERPWSGCWHSDIIDLPSEPQNRILIWNRCFIRSCFTTESQQNHVMQIVCYLSNSTVIITIYTYMHIYRCIYVTLDHKKSCLKCQLFEIVI